MIPKKLLKYNPELFAKGKRGLIYKFKNGEKEFIIKIKNPKSKAQNRVQNEINFLKLLNKYKIGPRLIEDGEDYFVSEFIEGISLKQYLKEIDNPTTVLNKIMEQCKILDKLRINKEEMHLPLKNIIIRNNNPILIDFERCHFTIRPKNANQFKEFLSRRKRKEI